MEPIDTDPGAFMPADERRDALAWLAAPHKYAPPRWAGRLLTSIRNLPETTKESA